jgi:phosphatidate cytidylyltransferase
MRTELAHRVIVAAIGVPFAVFVIYVGGWLLAIVLAAVAIVGAREFYALAARQQVRAFGWAGAAAAAGFVLVAAGVPGAHYSAGYFWILALALALVLVTMAIWARGVDGQPLTAAAVTLFGAVFVGGTLACAMFLRHLPQPGAAHWLGPALVAYPLALTWIGDSAAYFVGRKWGRRRLAPSVSPGKTVAGALASLVGATVAGALFALFVFDAWLGAPIGWLAGALGGLVISVVAQIGDLAESLLKREAGVKDSGRLLPGHGGALDRFDALFFSLPAAYLYLGVVLPLVRDGLPWP